MGVAHIESKMALVVKVYIHESQAKTKFEILYSDEISVYMVCIVTIGH